MLRPLAKKGWQGWADRALSLRFHHGAFSTGRVRGDLSTACYPFNPPPPLPAARHRGLHGWPVTQPPPGATAVQAAGVGCSSSAWSNRREPLLLFPHAGAKAAAAATTESHSLTLPTSAAPMCDAATKLPLSLEVKKALKSQKQGVGGQQILARSWCSSCPAARAVA